MRVEFKGNILAIFLNKYSVFLFFGIDAKPLGMSSGLISKQRITSYANKQESHPYLARFDLQGFGWQPFGDVEDQLTSENAKYWLQIVLPTLKKITYIIVQGSHSNNYLPLRYWIQYGQDENSLTTHKTRHEKVRLYL